MQCFCVSTLISFWCINENSLLKIHDAERSSIQYIISFSIKFLNNLNRSQKFFLEFHMNKQRSNKLIFFILMLMSRHCYIFISITKIAFSFAFSAFFTTLNPIVCHTSRCPTSSDRYFSYKKNIETINNRSGNSERHQDNFTFPTVYYIFFFFCAKNEENSSRSGCVCRVEIILNLSPAACSHLTLAKSAIFLANAS